MYSIFFSNKIEHRSNTRVIISWFTSHM